jgi:apoptosis-inducing factor 2
VWGVGDVGNLEARRMARVEPQVLHLAANLEAALVGVETAVRPFKPYRGTRIFVQIGDATGTGQWGRFRLFSFLGGLVKGKDMFETLKGQ